jgi:endogenous inhibitor of DNA gyrase (YacG/DUF329 family)
MPQAAYVVPQRERHHTRCQCCGDPTRTRFCSTGCQDLHAWERRIAPLEIRDCNGCGKPYARCMPSRFRYCSQQCKTASHTQIKTACAQCGKTVLKRPDQLKRYPTPYCSKSCAVKAHQATRPRQPKLYRLKVTHWQGQDCAVCGTSSLDAYCSEYCRQLHKRDGEQVDKLYQCVECGTEWLRWQRPGRRTYCSDECSLKVHRRNGKRTRRARLRAVKAETVDIRKVAERDGWRCHICKKKVTQKTWSLDHLVPLSYGGEHSYTNTALAHHRCNTLRSNTGSAQLRLAA